MTRRGLTSVPLALAMLLNLGSAGAQCPMNWIKTDGFPGAGVEPEVYAVTSWDPDGAGPQAPRLVAGGLFRYMTDSIVDGIAALNPETGRWEDLDGGIDFLTTDEEGNTFDEGTVVALGVYQNDLIVGGIITHVGTMPANGIARWNGASWSMLGTGLLGPVNSITEYNGELIASGQFAATGSGATVNRIARWDGTSWLPLGSPAGMNGAINNTITYNGELIAVGNFTTAGGVAANRIARWNGVQWQPLGTGLNASGFGLAVLDGDLYVGGNFTQAGDVRNTKGVARWDGANWHAVGGGPLNGVATLAVYDGDLIASGVFNTNVAGAQLDGLARFDTSAQMWGPMAPDYSGGGGKAFTVHNGDLYTVGFFREIGDRTASGIARWSEAAQQWERLAPGFNWTPSSFFTYQGQLIAGGVFGSAGAVEARGIARWDGQAWHALGGGIGHLPMPSVGPMAEYNGELYVGGHFSFADGGNVTVNHIAKWDGKTQTWSDVGGGVSGTEIPYVAGLTVYNGELVASGSFRFAGGVPVNNIARWNGSQWQPLGNGIEAFLNGSLVFKGELFVSHSSGMSRWNGTSWQVVPGGHASAPMCLYNGQLIAGRQVPHAYDGSTWTPLPGWSWNPNGIGLSISGYVVFEGDLVVAGMFEDPAGILEADHLVRFNGSSWSALTTIDGPTLSITSGAWVHNGELITGGRVEFPDGTMSNWRRFGPICLQGDLNADGELNADDQTLFCAALGSSQGDPNFDANADLTNDGAIDQDDQAEFNQLVPICLGDIVTSATFQAPPDGATDGADLAFLLGAWGDQPSCADFVTSATFQPPPDGKVDGADLAVLLGAWGVCD